MADVQLGARERAVLIVLMAAAREMSSSDLQQQYGLLLSSEVRQRLNELGLIVSTRMGRVLSHELTDRGWRFCRDELFTMDTPLPGTAGAPLQAVLQALGQFMTKSGMSPADIFGVDVHHGTEHRRHEAGSIEQRIRVAYRQLTDMPGMWVRLSELRPLLGSATHAEVDDALISLYTRHEAILVPESNQKMLTPQDRTAAVRCGGEDKHLIAIGDA